MIWSFSTPGGERTVQADDLHELGRRVAEVVNPAGEHSVVRIEIDGDPAADGVARVSVYSRKPGTTNRVAVSIDVGVEAKELMS